MIDGQKEFKSAIELHMQIFEVNGRRSLTDLAIKKPVKLLQAAVLLPLVVPLWHIAQITHPGNEWELFPYEEKVAKLQRIKLFREAEYLYKLAAAKGHREAQYRLGQMYSNAYQLLDYYGKYRELRNSYVKDIDDHRYIPWDPCVDKNTDFAESLHYYRLAADQGHPIALYELGMRYEHGQGLEQNYAKAEEYYQLAMNATMPLWDWGRVNMHHPAYSLAMMYEHGRGVAVDYIKAINFYDLIKFPGNPIFSTKISKMAIANKKAIYKKFNADDSYDLGFTYQQEKKYAEAIFLYQVATDKGCLDAQNNLGLMYYTGEGVS